MGRILLLPFLTSSLEMQDGLVAVAISMQVDNPVTESATSAEEGCLFICFELDRVDYHP